MDLTKEPEQDDPLTLNAVGVFDPSGESLRMMAACFAEEYLRLGFPPGRVLALFESPRYPLANGALKTLGYPTILSIVANAARVWSPAHRSHG
ncbi:MAG: hypothetical protein HOP15_17855 [Planctomycetes bacterium]|nr:hypothetical protein [Planctomycetota bacterium]